MSRAKRLAPALGLAPFLVYLLIFLVVPTVTVVVGAFQEEGRFTLGNLRALGSDAALSGLWKSVVLSGTTAVIGAVLGAVLAYLVVTLPATNPVRRVVTSVCGVLAQFGGVTLAFAFIATVGYTGVVTLAVRDVLGIDLAGSGWLYDLPGLMLVYSYFQIPLMVIVFMPALEGIRPQWREAAVNLGATTWQYWTRVAVPLLTPGLPRLAAAAVRQRLRGLRDRRPPWSARATRSCRCSSAPRSPARSCSAGRTSPSRSPSR